MPYDGQSSFLLKPWQIWTRLIISVSMPYDGQSSFLRFLRYAETDERGRVNALWRAIIISTGLTSSLVTWVIMCQCPMTGNHHFYALYGDTPITERDMCQCPMTGNHHFYATGQGSPIKEKQCVNALWRAIIISTGRDSSGLLPVQGVSMPYDGQSSFLRR